MIIMVASRYIQVYIYRVQVYTVRVYREPCDARAPRRVIYGVHRACARGRNFAPIQRRRRNSRDRCVDLVADNTDSIIIRNATKRNNNNIIFHGWPPRRRWRAPRRNKTLSRAKTKKNKKGYRLGLNQYVNKA